MMRRPGPVSGGNSSAKNRWALVGLSLVATLTLTTTGCGGTDANSNKNGGAASPSPQDPKQALAASVQGIAEGNFAFTMTDHESISEGTIHAPSKSAALTIKPKPGAEVDIQMGLITVGSDRWMKLTFGPELAQIVKMPNKWLHFDLAKITDAKARENLAIDFGDAEKVDPAGTATILKAIVDAQKTGDGTYSGSIDLTRATDAGLVDKDTVTNLGDKAKAVPFTASVDSQGRLTRLTLDVPAAGDTAAHKLEVAHTSYGSATPAQKPAASESQEAPPQLYEVLNS